MTYRENVPLASLTTLRVGGEARFLIQARTQEDITEAIQFARTHGLPLLVLGKGSNILIPDQGIPAVAVQMEMGEMRVREEGNIVRIEADAGISWDALVDEACSRGAYGVENLAGIPGSVGGGVVQNIGAYGAELSTVFDHAHVIDRNTGEGRKITRIEACFGYRTSLFKERSELIIIRAEFHLLKNGIPNLTYADVARAKEQGVPLDLPSDIARAIRAIRTRKFPDLTREGTAGSFFKNPVISAALAASLALRFPGIPTFPQPDGTAKISLAWLLDHALSLKGYAMGPVRLYEHQPLVITTSTGATANDVERLANDVAKRVLDATGIIIEREVETFGIHK